MLCYVLSMRTVLLLFNEWYEKDSAQCRRHIKKKLISFKFRQSHRSPNEEWSNLASHGIWLLRLDLSQASFIRYAQVQWLNVFMRCATKPKHWVRGADNRSLIGYSVIAFYAMRHCDGDAPRWGFPAVFAICNKHFTLIWFAVRFRCSISSGVGEMPWNIAHRRNVIDALEITAWESEENVTAAQRFSNKLCWECGLDFPPFPICSYYLKSK